MLLHEVEESSGYPGIPSPQPPVDAGGMKPSVDFAILDLASRQHGLVTRRQLIEAGVKGPAIAYRVRIGRLAAVHRGVYRSGPVTTTYHREMAAVLACGKEAVLSHRSAGSLWGLLHEASNEAPVDITTTGQRRPSRGDITIHRTRRLPVDERALRHGIPTTSAGRTLLDLASCIRGPRMERAVAKALRNGLVSVEDMGTLLDRHKGRRGIGFLRELVKTDEAPALTRSEAEVRFLKLMRRSGLPRPAVNTRLRGFEVDFLWRSHRLIVEIDGFAYHGGRAAFERDRNRDATLTAAGYRVVRITWRQLTRETEAVLARVAQALVSGTQTHVSVPPGRSE